MPAPWNGNRRRRYTGRIHQVDTRPQASEPALPASTSWRMRSGATEAHAFSTGPGWQRSVCRAEPWTVLLAIASTDVGHCDDCELLVNGAPGEISEVYGR